MLFIVNLCLLTVIVQFANTQLGKQEVKQEVKTCLCLYNLLAGDEIHHSLQLVKLKIVSTNSKTTTKGSIEQLEMSAYSGTKRQTLDICCSIQMY